MAKMDDGTLRALVKARRDASVNRLDSEYSKNRREALAFYRGEPHAAYGDDEPGMSKVISRDTMEAVESMLPALLKPFVSGEEVVRFEPTGPEDEEASKQASEYINYLFNRKNEGYEFITTTMKDGMLFRLGVGKVVFEEDTSYTSETYQGLSDIEVEALKMDESIEIESIEQDISGWTVQAKCARTKGKVALYAVPPDEFLFERHLARIQDATYLAQQSRRSVAELIAMGLDEERCKNLSDEDAPNYNTERVQRFYGENPTNTATDKDASRLVQVTESYLKCDYDGTGKLVWRKIITGGGADDILLNEPVDTHPYVAWTPIPIPHKLVGLSIHDLTRDLQLVKTALWRETLNNVYLTNRPMREVVEGQVNIDDVLTPRVGGLVRVKQAGMINNLATPYMAGNSLQLIEYTDTVREQRTGSTRYNQGLDADSLNKTATGISNIMAAAGQRLEMVARQYAEQFLKPLFSKMLMLVCKNPDHKEVIRLRNSWVEMDPREWKTEYDMSVTVGLGTGSREKMVMELRQLLEIDAQILALQGGPVGPLVTYDHIYEKMKRMVEAMGLKGVDNYYGDPQDQQPQQAPEQPQEDPNAKLMADYQAKIDAAKINAEADIEIAKINAEKDLIIAGMAAPTALEEPQMEPEMDGPGPDDMPMHEMAEAPEYEAMEPMMEGEQPEEPYGY